MAQVEQREIATEEEEQAERAGASGSTLGLLILGAAILWGGSFLLRTEMPLLRVGRPEHWLFFARVVLRDLMRAGGTLLAAVAVSSLAPGLGLWIQRIVFNSQRRTFLAVTASLALLTSALFSYFGLSALPHIQDEIAMHFQAKVFAKGWLYAPTPPLVDFFDYEFIVVDGPRWYGKYFPGPSLLMVPGVWLGAPWLVSPILAALAAVLMYWIGEGLIHEKVGRVAAVLMVLSPSRISLFAMMMAHPACMVSLALFTLAMIRLVRNPRAIGWAAAAGSGLGFAVLCRPLTALAIGGTVGILAALKMPWRRVTVTGVASSAIPLLVCVGLFLGYNKALTGDALLTPFSKWCPNDRLGFGPNVGLDYMPPQDLGHSVHKALFRNTYFSIDSLGTNLVGWGHVTLLLLVWPMLRSRWNWQTRAAGLVVLSVVVAYFFYYTHSTFAGQVRYWSEAMPFMMLLLAVALVNLRRWMPPLCRWLGLQRPIRVGTASCWTFGLLMSLWAVKASYLPIWDECAVMYWGQGPMLRDITRKAGIANALVFIPADHFREHARNLRWDHFGSGFALNDPDLRGDIIYARDLGDARNAELIARYPGRSLYWIDVALDREAELLPLDQVPPERRRR